MSEENESNVGKNDILKLLNVNSINQNTDKRKRGRPKKSLQLEQQPKTKNIQLDENEEDEEIILQLKLTKDEMDEVIKETKGNKNKKKDSDNEESDNDDIKNKDNDQEDNYDNDDISQSDAEFLRKEKIKDKTEKREKKEKKLKKIKKDKKNNLVDANDDIVSDDFHNVIKYNGDNENVESGKVLMDEALYYKMIKTMKLVKILNKELKNKDQYIEKITPMYSSVIETIPINFEIYDIDDHKKILMKKENVACWHCTEMFSGYPVYLPELYADGKFYVRPGFFHSFNCAAGFNQTLRDNLTEIRYSLLKQMFLLTHKDKINDPLDIKITPAPNPRYRLKKFGIGEQDIEEYNLKAKMIDCQYIDNVPLMVPTSGNLEVVFNNELNKNTEQTYKSRIESAV